MNKQKLLCFFLSLCLSSPLWAGKGKSSGDNLPQGRPFQIIQEEITQLTQRMEGVESAITQINSDIAGLSSRVSDNTDAIEELINSDAALRADLDGLAQQYQADYDDVQARIAALQSDVDGLRSDLAAARFDLEAQIENGDAGLLALITTLESELDNAMSSMQTLEGLQNDLAAQIAGLRLQADALSGRVDTLEGYHVTYPTACDTGTDPGTNSPWVVCEADENRAWISADNGGRYHAELICLELGYRTVGVWGGTCGSVCGFCQGPTSCENTGLTPEQRDTRSWNNYNGGTDALGPMIHRTVQWTCVQ
ncbi:putative nucleic acid-binding Zn-ribbon protein [Litorivivens lipolytica]|uniref:Putative nucleic acid-binding Zn-ribbon protein n=1 Tax=Litorivivens lipolytica TaxID=1524264 RepID=A0A7W4Z758_9GAMM|nr:hypothetical protein [Litorivivens lipolytica]MBB3047581.1 putative nucleic acid-binding Zn-ribbon protein [Litorivivens lipolytica]